MGSDNGNVYMIRGGVDDGEDEWVSPVPAEDVIVERLVDESDLGEDDVDDLSAYVDLDDLATVLNDGADDELRFTVEGHEVTVTSDGDVEIEGYSSH